MSGRRAGWGQIGGDRGSLLLLHVSPAPLPQQHVLASLGVFTVCLQLRRPSFEKVSGLSFSQPANTTHEFPFTPVRDCPGSSVVKTPCFHCGELGFDPWSRSRSCMQYLFIKKKERYPSASQRNVVEEVRLS